MHKLNQIGIAGAMSIAATLILQGPVSAQLAMTDPGSRYPSSIFEPVMPQVEAATPEIDDAVETPAHLRRQIVAFPSREAPGTVIIDTPNTYL